MVEYNRNSDICWLRLNWVVPVDLIMDEYKSLSQDDLIIHRPEDGHKDWFAVTLYGYGSNKTNSHWEYLHLKERKQLTDIGKRCPKTMEWIYSLPYNRIDDIRFLVIKPHGYIKPHIDVPDRNWLEPVNIAIYWPPKCKFTFVDKGDVPYKTGSAFLLNIHYKHGVVNDSDEERIHLLIHGKKKREFWNDIIHPS